MKKRGGIYGKEAQVPHLLGEAGMTQVEPIWRPENAGLCECGCGAEGSYKRPWKNGQRCVKLKCRCPRCVGKANRRGGLKKQNAARKALGIPGSKFGDSAEERWQDAYFANEVKSGKQCGPLSNWWARVEKQVLANEADHGSQRRPVRAVAMPEGWGDDGLVVVRLSTWRDHIGPALDEFYGGAA